MFSSRALDELEARRQQLIAAAQTQRSDFQQNLAGLAHALAWPARVTAWLQAAQPFFWAAAPAAGLFVARRVRSVLRLVPILLPWWRIARTVITWIGPKRP